MLKFVDLFAGTGGMRLGMEQACGDLGVGCKCAFSAEIDRDACDIYKLNFGQNPYCDITQAKQLPAFDLLLAGFPCQPFSYAGRQRGMADTRGTLFFEIERLLASHQPKLFLLENVRGLTTHNGGKTLATIKASLKALGYSIQCLLLNSANFCVPQNRARLYILGVRHDTITSDLISCLTPVKASVVVGDVLEDRVPAHYHCSPEFTASLKRVVGDDLSKLHGYRLIDTRGGKSIHSWQIGLKGECTADEISFMNLLIQNRRKKKFGSHQDGKSLTLSQIATFCDIPHLREVATSLVSKGYLTMKDCRYNPASGNMSFEVFKFLHPDGLSITLTASDTNRLGVVINNIPRHLTPRECARLQGYPDEYKLLANDRAMYKLMGNAVSVPVVKALGIDLLKNNYKQTKQETKTNEQTTNHTKPYPYP